MTLTPHEEIARGRAAAEALRPDSVLTGLLSELEAKYREDARGTASGSAGRDEREAIHAKTCALDDIRTQLRIRVQDGDYAAKQLAEEDKRKPK